MSQSNVSSTSVGRRQLLTLAATTGALSLLPAGSTAAQQNGNASPPPRQPAPEPAAPVVDARFPHEIADGVFILPDRRIPLVPNIGIIVGRERALIVDCGLGPTSAEGVLAIARRLAPGRELILTITHAHPEHGFGAQVFKGQSRIWYNQLQARYLALAGPRLLDGFRTSILPPQHRSLLRDVTLVQPDSTYTGETATLDLGGRNVVLRTWGIAHSPGDQIVHVPDQGIVFAGDLIEERIFPIVPLFPPLFTAADMNVRRWEAVLADIAALQPRVIVPGHGNLGGPELVTAIRNYFQEARSLVEERRLSRTAMEERLRRAHPTWEQSQFIAPTIEYLSQTR